MPKINSHYDSLYDFLNRKQYLGINTLDAFNTSFSYGSYSSYRFYWAFSTIAYYNAFTGRTDNFLNSENYKYLGGLQPIFDIGEDFLDTFKRYSSHDADWRALETKWQVLRELFQPIHGILNIAKGIAHLIIVPILFIYNTYRYADMARGDEYSPFCWRSFNENMFLNLKRSGSWILDGISSLIRGVSQIIATPLTWFVKIPLRGILTLVYAASNKLRSNKKLPLVNTNAEETANPVEDNKHLLTNHDPVQAANAANGKSPAPRKPGGGGNEEDDA